MSDYKLTFTGDIWLWQGKGAWHFITLPTEDSSQLKFLTSTTRRGWGSLPATVRIADTQWTTSLFPDKKRDAFLLPLKADVRKREGLTAGDTVEVSIIVSLN